MQLTLNREYATRHLGVAVLFLALCGWFLYDASVTYPQRDESYFTETLHTRKDRAIARQYQFAGLSGAAAVIIALLVAREWKKSLSWDETALSGSLVGNRPLPFAEIVGVKDDKWKSKGILTVYARDGRSFVLDTWHHAGARELAEKIRALLPAKSEPAG
ncbi:MAG: hypothetical protein ACI4Q3_09070 [Kiritimatiellia bacterium]